MMRQDHNGVVYVGIWVDDSLIVGHTAAIEATVKDLQETGFKLKTDGTLEDYLSCNITFDKDKKNGWIHQPHLLQKIEKKFWPQVKKLKRYETPASTNVRILRNPDVKVELAQHKEYRSGVGMLLYLVKHTRPDIANAVRELSKVLDGPSPDAYKEMLRCIKYVIDTKHLALRLSPRLDDDSTQWSMLAYSDSDWANDPETRISVTGFILYLCGVPISWKSKSKKSVSLSSSEAEFYAMSETAKEIKFVYQVLQSMGIEVRLPIIIRVDNIGAIFMAENMAVSQRTKHIDTRARFINEFVEDEFLRIIFVRSADNDADLYTKNLGGELHGKHASKNVTEKKA
jgi:hypothetical protein